MEEHFLEPVLQCKSEIHVALGNLRVRTAWLSEEFLNTLGKMASQPNRAIGQHLHALIAAQRLEVGEIKLETAVSRGDNLRNLTAVRIFAIRRQAHDLAFVPVLRVADEFTDHRIETAQRVGEKDAIQHLDVVPLTARHHGRHEPS